MILRFKRATPIWLYTTMDVWSRLWISTKVGDRKEYHVKAVISDTLQRGKIKHRFLFTTDGFKPYYSVIRELIPDRCVYGQVLSRPLSLHKWQI